MFPLKKVLLPVCFLLALLSCRKIIDIELVPAEPKIVVNGFFSDSEPLRVHLSKSISVLDHTIPVIEDAFVVLKENGVRVDTLIKNDAYFYSDITAGYGKEYSLIIKTQGMDTVFCTDYLPEKIFIDDYRLHDSLMLNDEGMPIMQFEFSISDPPGENYYELLIENDDGIWFERNTDPVVLSSGLLDYSPGTIIFDDALFNGKSHTIRVNYAVQADLLPKIGSGPEYSYPLNISFRSVSESYFKYKEKQVVYLFSLENDILSGINEPVQLFSNIVDGLGIFAGYSSDDKQLEVIVE